MFTYDRIIRQTALRVNAVVGATKAAKQAAYIVTPLTATQIGSLDFPFASIQDAALSSVARIVRTYANIKGHPLHNYHATQTAGIAHEGNIPYVDSGGKSIIGVYGAIRDATTGDEMTEMPVQMIRSIVASTTDGTLKGDYFHYKIAGRRLNHTRASAVIDVVTFDEPTQRTALSAGGNCPLADGLFDLAWCGAVAALMVDDSYIQQAQLYESYVQGELSKMERGAATFAPAPELINTASPGVS